MCHEANLKRSTIHYHSGLNNIYRLLNTETEWYVCLNFRETPIEKRGLIPNEEGLVSQTIDFTHSNYFFSLSEIAPISEQICPV